MFKKCSLWFSAPLVVNIYRDQLFQKKLKFAVVCIRIAECNEKTGGT